MNFNDDIMLEILHIVDIKTLQQMCFVNKTCLSYCLSSFFWKRKMNEKGFIYKQGNTFKEWINHYNKSVTDYQNTYYILKINQIEYQRLNTTKYDIYLDSRVLYMSEIIKLFPHELIKHMQFKNTYFLWIKYIKENLYDVSMGFNDNYTFIDTLHYDIVFNIIYQFIYQYGTELVSDEYGNLFIQDETSMLKNSLSARRLGILDCLRLKLI